MPFTDRFVQIPVEIVDRELEEMSVKQEPERSFINMNPFKILYYFPLPENDEHSEQVRIFFDSGDHIIVDCTLMEFENLLNNHVS